MKRVEVPFYTLYFFFYDYRQLKPWFSVLSNKLFGLLPINAELPPSLLQSVFDLKPCMQCNTFNLKLKGYSTQSTNESRNYFYYPCDDMLVLNASFLQFVLNDPSLDCCGTEPGTVLSIPQFQVYSIKVLSKVILKINAHKW